MASANDAPSPPRFRVSGELGRGGMGVVYLAHDTARGQDVALKRVLATDAASLRRFKREFRVMADLVHPNLVRLHELAVDEAGAFFTMELLQGTDLFTYCAGGDAAALLRAPTATGTRPAGAISPLAETAHVARFAETGKEPALGDARVAAPRLVRRPFAELRPRLERVLPELLRALSFLHANGVVHRDLKPSNVIVSPEGVLKLLDFGVIAELTRHSGEGDGPFGTVGYMAPEQLEGGPVTPACDAYALGALLYFVVAARPVFEGAPWEVLRAHTNEAPRHLREIADDAPEELDLVCHALLSKDPRRRPTLAEAAARLRLLVDDGAVPMNASVTSVRGIARDPLGRTEAKASLAAALKASREGGGLSLVLLTGPSGSGKTTLAQWATREASRAGAHVLRGRGRAADRVPYNAIDGAIDDLAALLSRAASPPQIAVARALAAGAFPALGSDDELPTSSPTVGRADVFDALASVLRAAASRAPLVLAVDDLQWADDDSVALLAHLAESSPAKVVVIATLRTDVAASEPLARLLEGPRVQRIDLGPLDEASLRAIVSSAAGPDATDSAVTRAVRTCAGRPFLAEIAGRALAHEADALASGTANLAEAIVRRALDRGPELLAILVATDAWTRVGALAALTARTAGDTEDALDALAREGIVRRAGPTGPDGDVALYHDLVRAAALDALDPDVLQRAHGAVADHLAQELDVPPERLVVHLIVAGRDEEAASYARAAARTAARQKAYALAAEMYELALRFPGDARVLLLRARAEALEGAGRDREAVACWEEASAAVASGV